MIALPTLVVATLAGAAIGSFACVVARRMPRGADWTQRRSACEACGVPLRGCDLVPLVSWAVLGGRCRRCRTPIPGDHTVLEVLGAIVPLWAALVVPLPAFWLTCGLGWGLLALAAVDAASFRLPLGGTLPLLVAGLGAVEIVSPGSAASHAAAACAAWLGMEAVAWIYRMVRGREGLGGGDAWLLAAGGAWAGPAALPGIVFLAAVSAVLYSGIRARRVVRHMAVPFGPFLAGGIWIAWLYGPLFLP